LIAGEWFLSKNSKNTPIFYKWEMNGRTYHKINRFYASSQTCNVCGYKNVDTKDLNVRKWVCESCGVVHQRDRNAAINIQNQGLKELSIA
jgi:putative transposase